MAERHEEEDRGRVGLASLAVDRQAGGRGQQVEMGVCEGQARKRGS